MAKKKSSRGDFNMSSLSREILKANPEWSSTQLYEEMTRLHPEQEINRNSLNVAFSQARHKLGLRMGKRSVKRKKPSAVGAVRPKAVARTVSTGAVDVSLLMAAHEFVKHAGGADQALNAIEHVKRLQLN